MGTFLKKIWPYVCCTVIVMIVWKMLTLTDNYAWFPKGKERPVLDISLWFIFIYKTIFWVIISNTILFALIQFVAKKKTNAVLSAIIAIILFTTLNPIVSRKCAPEYYIVFCKQSVSEEYIQRPLLEAGYPIAPYLNSYIIDSFGQYRRYATHYLGVLQYQPAVPTLKAILLNKTEKEELRADAFAALYKINSQHSIPIVNQFRKESTDSAEKHVISLADNFLESGKD